LWESWTLKPEDAIFQTKADDPSTNGRPCVFAYWDGDLPDALSDFKREWREAFSQFVIFGNNEVKLALNRIFPSFVEIYDSIRIPAAKADIARLILLYEFGGLYVDCHCGIVDAKAIEKNLGLLTCL
jgi:mannosyltransferase OCH1-like enzyme